jgi:hypothetical protein
VATGDATGSIGGTSRTGTGSNSGDALPTQTQGEIAWRTSLFVAGRRLQGRTFVPAPSETESSSGAPVSIYTSRLTTAAVALLNSTPTAFPVVWSRAHGTYAAITSHVARPGWKVLRSRRNA